MENTELMNYNGGMLQSQPASGGISISDTREASEVQAAVFMAKRFPRDENAALARINKSCQRIGLASKAIYAYPRGDKNVTGPSIRLAEALAQAWGNVQTSWGVLETRPGESVCMAYCWDIETNFRDMRMFTVKHELSTRNGTKVLTDPRDIYELIANQCARRKRACILSVIPKDVVDAAVETCQKTLSTAYKEPLIDRLRKMVSVFEQEFSVSLGAIERYMGYKLEAFTELDMVTLRGVYAALRDGEAKREDYFTLKKPEPLPETEDPEEIPEPHTKKKAAKKEEAPDGNEVKLRDL